jgi:hypothetical protein
VYCTVNNWNCILQAIVLDHLKGVVGDFEQFVTMTGFIVSLRNFNLRFGSNLKRNIRSHSSASGGTASTAPPSQASAVLKAGLTSGSLSLLGDVMAQVMTNRSKQVSHQP